MRKHVFLALFIAAFTCQLTAQRACQSFDYGEKELLADPSLQIKIDEVEGFIRRKLAEQGSAFGQRGEHLIMITIPVVVHILYHQVEQNISDEQVFNQIALLNQCFRRLNADTSNTPDRFISFAADCEIEFKLAIADPVRRATTGITRKYTPVTKWDTDDQMKFSAKGGDDAWDSKNFMNIWVCNLNKTLGYASFPGGPAGKDGIVISLNAFGSKTAVHEAGHWLGLRHVWGDAYCGDDGVGDTPKQGNFTSGCPSGIRLSCSNAPDGDMYMNYMDLTDNACINLFTKGQKERMRALFDAGGARYTILSSCGLLPPLINEIPVAEELPKWFSPHLYPNPGADEITLDLSCDIRWVGKVIKIIDMRGQLVMNVTVGTKIMKINIGRLKPGMYFISAKKEDGTTIKQKLIKM